MRSGSGECGGGERECKTERVNKTCIFPHDLNFISCTYSLNCKGGGKERWP